MSLVIRAAFNKQPTLIKITDRTGLFNNDPDDPNYNPHGWQNGTTAFITNATAAKLLVSVPDPITLLPTATPVQFDIYNALPNFLFKSTTVDIEGVDGVYYFTFTVTVTSLGMFKFSEYKLFTPLIDCCMQRLSDAAVCGKIAQKVFSDAWDIYETMKMSSCCGKPSEAVVQLKKLNKICRQQGCCSSC